MPVLGRHDLEVAERLLAPAEEAVALAVALVLEFGVVVERAARVPKSSTCTEWSMTSSTGMQRVDLRRVAAQRLHRVAHGGQVDDAGTPVKSCSSTRAGVKPISRVRLRLRLPLRQGLDVGLANGQAVLVAEQVFEQDFERERKLLGLRVNGCSTAARRWMVYGLPSTDRVDRLPKLFGMLTPAIREADRMRVLFRSIRKRQLRVSRGRRTARGPAS